MTDYLDEAVASETPRPAAVGLGDDQRLIVQNLFDTQPERKKAYLKQLGFELNPKDDNEYKPAGSDGKYKQIDPGFSAYFAPGGLKELAKDFGDVSWDTLVAAPAVSVGGAKFAAEAGAVGAAIAGPPGMAALGLTGFVLGGGLGNAASELLKEAAGNIALDENIPSDKKAMAVQSFISGSMPLLFKAGRNGARQAYSEVLKKREQALISAASTAGGKITPELLESVAKNPDLFTPEAVKGGRPALRQIFKNYMGIEDDEILATVKDLRKIRPESDFGKKLAPLFQQSDEALELLSKDAGASANAMEALSPIIRVIDKSKTSFDGEMDDAAEILEKELVKYAKKLGVKGRSPKELIAGLKEKTLDFGQQQEILDNLQRAAYVPGKAAGSVVENPIVASVSGEFRKAADARAAARGVDWNGINAQQSEIFSAYGKTRNVIKSSDDLFSAFIGGDKDRLSDIKQILRQNDELLGTSRSKDIDTGAMQAAINKVYTNKADFASGRSFPAMASGFMTGAAKAGAAGAVVGATTGVGAVPAAIAAGVAGGVRGAQQAAAMRSPEVVIQNLIKNSRSMSGNEAALGQMGTSMSPESIIGNLKTVLSSSGISGRVAEGAGMVAAQEASHALAPDPAVQQNVTPTVSKVDEYLKEAE